MFNRFKLIMKQIIIFNVFLALALNLSSQDSFIKTFERQGIQTPHSITQLNNGNFVVVGKQENQSVNDGAFAACISPTGELVWWKNLIDYDLYYAMSVDATNDNNIVLQGSKELNSNTHIVKLTETGDSAWIHALQIPWKFTYISGINDTKNRIITTLDGGIASVSTGMYVNQEPEFWNREMFIAKLDANGDTLWTDMNNSGVDGLQSRGVDICEDSMGNLYITGWKDGGNASCDFDSYLRKYDSFGNLIFEKEYYPGYGYSLSLTSDDNILMTTSSFSHNPNGPSGPWLIKVNSTNGDTIQIKRSFGWDKISSYQVIKKVTNDGFIGITKQYFEETHYPVITKFNENLEVEWHKKYLFPYFIDIIPANNGYALVREDQGNLSLIIADSTGSFGPTSNIKELSDNLKKLTIHPNPSYTGVFTIRSTKERPLSLNKIRLTTIQGQEISLKGILSKQLNGNVLLDINQLDHGTYIVTYENGNKVDAYQMIQR